MPWPVFWPACWSGVLRLLKRRKPRLLSLPFQSIWIEAPLEVRIRNILADYPARDSLREQFALPLRGFKERCGRQAVEELLALLERGAWEELVRELMLRYYDPLYRHTFPARRIEVTMEPLEAGLASLKAAISAILANIPEPGPHGQAD